MDIKIVKFLGLFLLLTTLTGCPGGDEDDCFDYGSTTRVDDLITLTPLQSTYNEGDEVIFKVVVPSTNVYFGNEKNLFQLTNDNNASLVFGSTYLFESNSLTFISGSQGQNANWFNVNYNPVTFNYELEIKVKLNKVGNYSFYSDGTIHFEGSSKCNRYRIDTNIAGWDSEGKIIFTVQ